MTPIPRDEQIRLLLQGKAYGTVRALFPGKQLTGSEYKEVFTVKRADVIEYVKRNGFPHDSYGSRPGGGDGPYMIDEEGVCVVYCQEREAFALTNRGMSTKETPRRSWLTCFLVSVARASTLRPNPSIEGTSAMQLRCIAAAPHVKR